MSRAFILLLDSFGLGATPDADKYGDQAWDLLEKAVGKLS